MQNKILIFLLLLFNTNCEIKHCTRMESNTAQKMTYKQAYEYCIKYAEYEGIDFKSKLKVNTENRFRFDFNSIDISFNNNDSILIVRACIASQNPPKREDLITILDSLSEKYKSELAGGNLEFDETAIEVDGFKPNRLNVRRDFINSEIEISDFIKEVDDLLTAALRWRNKYYLSTYDELDRKLNMNNPPSLK